MKSDSARGMRIGMPWPRPRPSSPPQPIPNIDSTSWKLVAPWASE